MNDHRQTACSGPLTFKSGLLVRKLQWLSKAVAQRGPSRLDHPGRPSYGRWVKSAATTAVSPDPRESWENGENDTVSDPSRVSEVSNWKRLTAIDNDHLRASFHHLAPTGVENRCGPFRPRAANSRHVLNSCRHVTCVAPSGFRRDAIGATADRQVVTVAVKVERIRSDDRR
jgi:hypothetical protein